MNTPKINKAGGLSNSPAGPPPPPIGIRSPSQQPNGAALIADKAISRINIEKVAQSHRVWGDNVDNDSFTTLRKILDSQNEGIKLQQTIMKSRPQTQEYLRTALKKFSPGREIDKEYDDNYRQKLHLGLKPQQIGFKSAATIEAYPDLDNFWRHLIETAAVELGTNKLAAYRALRRLAQQQNIFKRLYESQIGGKSLKPKIEQINTFFKQGTNVVDEEGADFQAFLSRIALNFYQEISACINCFMQFFDEKTRYAGFRSLFQASDYSMPAILWDIYKRFSKEVLVVDPTKEKKLTERSQKYVVLKTQLSVYKMKELTGIIKLFCTYLNNYNDDSNPIILGQENHMEAIVKQLDGDIILCEKSNISKGINTDTLTRLIVELFLLIFPFEQCQQKIDKHQKYISDIKSQSLQLVRLLFTRTGDDSSKISKVMQQFEHIAKNEEWNAFTPSWKKWLGIFLRKYKDKLKKNTKELTKKIILLCKNVVSEYYREFWSDKPAYYLNEIKNFIQGHIQAEDSTTINEISMLPICTKLLGKIYDKKTDNVLEIITQKVASDIFTSITSTLKLDSPSKQSMKHQRIIYTSQNQKNSMDPVMEQEIKFTCRLIQVQADCLYKLQRKLLYDQMIDPNELSTGAILIVKIFQIFYSIQPDTPSRLRCLRYLIKAINALFVCNSTRNLVCIALAALESGKLNHTNKLRSIVNACYDYDVSDEIGRQTEKLRIQISFHLNCIVKVSDNLDQYFPTTTQREASHLYRKLHQYLFIQRNYKEANTLIEEIRSECSVGFRAVQWFYEFAKLLQSKRLTANDFDTIRLLLLKMRIKNEQSRQYANLSAIVDILNHGSLDSVIIESLTPIVKREKTKRSRQKYFLGLANRDFEGFMSQAAHRQFLSAKYSNKSYRNFKEKYLFNKEKHQLYRKLSGCLSIIETMLRLTLQSDFPLLKKINFYNSIFESLFSDKPYMYNIKFIYSFEKPRDERHGLISLFSSQWVEKQFNSSVNLMHCIASFWDFQDRLRIDDSEHPSNSIKLVGQFSVDLYEEKYYSDIIYYSLENVLTDINRKPQSIGVGTISKILQYILLLGGGKTLYYSILSRNYPINKGMAASKSNFVMLEQFIEGLTYTAVRKTSSLRQREHVIELLSVFIREKHFGEYIRNNIFRLKEALARGRQFADISRSTRLVAQLLHFLNMLLSIDGSSSNIKFVKSCLSDPVQFGMKLLAHCQNRIGLLTDATEGAKKSKYGTFAWLQTTREAAVCKLALLLYLGISSYLISNEHYSLSQSLSSLILKNSTIFLKSTQIIQNQDFSKRFQKLELKQSLKEPGFTTSNHSNHFVLNQAFLNALLLNSPFSFIQNYLEQPWQVLQNSPQKESKELVLAVHRYNAISALHFANEALIQYYYLLLNSIFSRGQSGRFFTLSTESIIQNKIPSIVMYKKQKARNQLSTNMLMGEAEGLSNCCFRLRKDIQKEIWGSTNTQAPRDTGLLMIGEIINSLEQRIIEEPHLLTESKKLVDKIIAYLKIFDSRFHFSVLIRSINSVQKLSQKIFFVSLQRKQGIKSVFQAYFKRIQQCILSIQTNVCLDDLSKMKQEHLFVFLLQCCHLFETEIQNIQKLLEKHKNDDVLSYLESEDRIVTFEKYKAIVKSVVPLLTTSEPSSTALIFQLLSKAITIDHLSKRSKNLGIVRPMNKDLFSKIEKICERITGQDDILSIFILKFIMEVAVFAQSDLNRQITRTMKGGLPKITQHFQKITDIKSLTEIVKNSYILGAVASLSLQQNWKNQEFQNILDKIFFNMQEKPLHFSYQKIIPDRQIQVELSNKYLGEIRRGKETSIFSVISEFCMFDLVKNYLLFFSFSIKFSPSLIQLCNNTFNKGPLEDLSLDRLRESLVNAIQFMNKFSSVCFCSRIEQIIKINSFTCIDHEIIRQSNLLSLCFQNYQSKYDFYTSVFDTLTLLSEAIGMLCQTWEKYDWKSTSDWRSNRKDLLLQFQKLIILYKGNFKDFREFSLQRHLLTITDFLKGDSELSSI